MEKRGGKPAENWLMPVLSNERERAILEYIHESGSVKSKQVEELLHIKASRSRELLKQMVDKNYISKQGQGKSTFYAIVTE